ncbi:uncharacterized protein LAESUDRAFT_760988 [Laetiporus sulphureus 93-53]|uniref:Uncharacterized protein n=1 Tax=Laetiporus sulphureus 93-53 TaxID=1314785 RepID=A0A165DEF3_9APHY|nr:uncharacterized protein LAESUDRAFT_760988 [Laetiporus sulphureus 93-53]KZT04702.1 hypothetical protein LAESUDRAFT_760988 [Laetiporus sulphureus 93-53]
MHDDMDTSLSAVPRLRLTRPQSRTDTYTPVAGPSRLSPNMNPYEEEQDEEATPRVPTASIAPDPSQPSNGSPGSDRGSSRLRALLARVPNTNPTTPPRATSSRVIDVTTPSEPDSDLDPPYSTTATPSFARESLRVLFSRALREPGNTPRRESPRHNSLDESEVETTPREETFAWEASGKDIRRDLSDEEAERLANTSKQSDETLRLSPAAATYDALRERLVRSRTVFPSPPPAQMVTEMSMPPTDTETNTTEANEREEVPLPAATPMRTLQMSDLEADTNLLDGDTEMQKELGAVGSSDNEMSVPARPPSFPPPRPKTFTSPARSASWESHSKSHHAHGIPLTRPTVEIPPLRRLSHGGDEQIVNVVGTILKRSHLRQQASKAFFSAA